MGGPEQDDWLAKFRQEHPDPGEQKRTAAPPEAPPAVEASAPSEPPPSSGWLQGKTDVILRAPRPKTGDLAPRFSSQNPALFVPDADARIQATVTSLVENLHATVQPTTEDGRTSLYIYGLDREAMSALAKKLDESAIACQIKGLKLTNSTKPTDAGMGGAQERVRRWLFIAFLLAVTLGVYTFLTSRGH